MPIVVLALIAVAVLLPESRSSQRPQLDPIGVLTSSAGLVGLTYGAIEAGQRGWGDPRALAPLTAGVLILVTFVLWQRRMSLSPTRQPLVDLTLFRSPSFAWGTILATVVSFALFGVLFAVPQFFQAVGGADAFGTGLRLLPIIGGLLAGSQIANLLARRAGAKVTAAVGFTLLAAGLMAGATTGVSTGYGFAAAWITVVGVGMGFTLPTVMNAAVSALSAERSGVGSALMMATRQVGGTVGVAVLGSVLNSRYRGRLDVAGLPAQAAQTARQSVSAGVAAAHQLGSAPLLDSVSAAFVHGMDVMLWVCGGLMIFGIALTLVFLPSQPAAIGGADAEPVELEDEVAISD